MGEQSNGSPPTYEGLASHIDMEGMQPGVNVASWVETEAAPAAALTAGGGAPPPAPPPLPPFPGGRVKTKVAAKKQAVPPAAQRKWLVIEARGDTHMLSMLNKTEITQNMGIQLRDLRLLDPKLATSYPSAILSRERAMIVNLEHIKMIVTMERAYVTNLEDENVVAFLDELKRRLFGGGGGGAGGMASSKSMADFVSGGMVNGGHAGGGGGGPSGGGDGGADDMPFELRVVEVALDMVAAYLERLTADLEAAAHPALDALTLKVSTSNLERVRRIKNRMVRLTTRVETLREVLEKFLDDDSDMRDLNLTAKEVERQQESLRHATQRSATATPFDVPLPLRSAGGVGGDGGKTPGTPRSVASSYDQSEEAEEAIEEVEMLLENYFMQVDGTYNKLQTLCEYVDDTEDFINIELDNHRNQLIRLDLMLTAFSAAVGLITAITGLFAMNVNLTPDGSNDGNGSYNDFLIIAISTAVGAIAMFATVIGYARYRRLI